MTALSVHAPHPAHLDQRPNITSSSRSTGLPSLSSNNSSSRRTHADMSQTHAPRQQVEASSSRAQINGRMASEQPGELVLRAGRPNLNGRRQSETAAPISSHRPSSAPGNNHDLPEAHANGAVSDDEDDSSHLRPQKPPLLRSKSEHGLRNGTEDHPDEEYYEWGARHGFEDHYQSEDYISALANVSINSAQNESPRGPDLLQRPFSTLALTYRRVGICILPTSDMRIQGNPSHRLSRYRIGA